MSASNRMRSNSRTDSLANCSPVFERRARQDDDESLSDPSDVIVGSQRMSNDVGDRAELRFWRCTTDARR
jgi:hypothetical protein